MNKKEWRLFAISSTLPALVFLIWDSWATSRGHWQFNTQFITGLKLGNLPLEEVLFFWVIPFCCHFVWRLIQKYNNFTHLLQDFFLLNQNQK